jgi:hypothetical protein
MALKLIAEGEPYRSYTPNAATLDHIYQTNFTRFYIQDLHPNATWTSEREIRSNMERTKLGEKREHVPDAIVTLEDDRRIAIEVELSGKAYARLDKILHELATSDYSAIWYFTLNQATNVVNRAIKHMQEERHKRKFEVHPLDDLELK